jgi:hypothetical protein
MFLYVKTFLYLCEKIMQTFKEKIIIQVEKIETGKIFTAKDLNFPLEKLGQVTCILSGLYKEGKLKKIEKGAYYKPLIPPLSGFKDTLGVYGNEMLGYLTKKMNGYITGLGSYNQLNLTEQVANVTIIATPKPVRKFKFYNYNIETIKSYYNKFDDKNTVFYLRLLDAMKDIDRIPARSATNVYQNLKNIYISKFNEKQLKDMVELAKKYPPKVRKIFSDILNNLGYKKLQEMLLDTINPTTKFNLKYRKYESSY